MSGEIQNLCSKRNLIIILSILIAAVAVCSGVYYFDRLKPYDDLLTSANKAMAKENYDSAVKWYNQAETYKKTSDVDKKIQIAGVLKKSKENYTVAIKKMNNKEYLNAIDSFKKVNKQDTKRYDDSQSKITKCKKLYISDNLNKAKDDIKNNKFDDASTCLNNIFKLDASNTDAKKLKNDIANNIQKQEDQAVASTVSAQIPTASGSVSFEQALSMVLKAEFPDNKYAEIKNDNGSSNYVSLDSSALNGNKDVKYQADIRGRTISYDSNNAMPIEERFDSDNGSMITKTCYDFALATGGHVNDGYYVEASTGKVYKYDLGHLRSVN